MCNITASVAVQTASMGLACVRFYLTFKTWFVSQEQDGIAPQMFKSVIGRGHPEFSTSRQQDAQEFFMHLVSTIDRAEVCF